MKLLFWLYRSHINSKGLTPLMMRITMNGKRINFPTQIYIEEKTWDKNKQVIKGTDPLIQKYNRHLLTLKAKAWDVCNEKIKEGKPLAAEQVRAYVLGEWGTEHTLLEAIDYHLNHLRARVGLDVALGTIKNYQTARSKVCSFLKSKGSLDIPLNELSHQFIHELDHFLRVQQGLHNNGVVKIMQQLKRVIRVAILNEWMEKDPFAHYQCKIIEPKRVCLSKEELQLLDQLPLPSERLEKVRDLFLFSCYTGLAYADVSKLNPVHLQVINGSRWIVLDRTKTKNQSVIPLLPKAATLLSKYEGKIKGKLLPVISSQNVNKYLKELSSLAGITKRLTYHVARHTFGSTITLNEGIDITTVSAMLGHKLLKTTQIYARVDLNKITRDMEPLQKRGGV